MVDNSPVLTHQQQQKAAEVIHKLMQEGMSSQEAIVLVAKMIREKRLKLD